MRLVVGSVLGSLWGVVLMGGCSSDAKEEKPQANPVPPYSAPKAAPVTPAKTSADKAPAKKVGFQ